jgi:hypothetical protein
VEELNLIRKIDHTKLMKHVCSKKTNCGEKKGRFISVELYEEFEEEKRKKEEERLNDVIGSHHLVRGVLPDSLFIFTGQRDAKFLFHWLDAEK